jgi:hypothetical protein
MAKRLTATALVGAVLAAMSGGASANVDKIVEQVDQRYQPLAEWFATHPFEFKLFLKSLGNFCGEIDDYVVLAQARELGAPPKTLVTPKNNTPAQTKQIQPTVNPQIQPEGGSRIGQKTPSVRRPRCW